MRNAVAKRAALVLPFWTLVSSVTAQGTAADDALYDRLFPHHVEVCALSQLRPLGEAPAGGAGHAVMYLSDVCRKPAPYPQLELCEGHEGTGVSVNKAFRNVNWVAVPGRAMFFDGELEPGKRLTGAHVESVIREAAARGLFDGIELHEDVLAEKPPGTPLAEFAARQSVATDFALRFGRTAVCSHLPVTPVMLQRIVAALNRLNREYAEGDNDYRWSGYADNCTHTIHNALAAADVWGALHVNTIRLRQLFNLAVPANEAVRLADLANDFRIENFPRVHANRRTRRTLTEAGWLPGRHGGLVRVRGVHAPNDRYETGFHIFVLEGFLMRPVTWRANRMLADPRYTELRPHLLHWRDRYARILASRSDGAEEARGDFAETRALYYDYIEEQHASTEAMLRELEATP